MNILSSLETMLLNKAVEIESVANLGQSLLKQQLLLETKIKSFKFNNSNPTTAEISEESNQLESLQSQLDQWTIQNNILYSTTTTTTTPTLPIESISNSLTRRNKNNEQHRTDSLKWAEEISSSLLTELRRVQGKLKEADINLSNSTQQTSILETKLEESNRKRSIDQQSLGQFHSNLL